MKNYINGINGKAMHDVIYRGKIFHLVCVFDEYFSYYGKFNRAKNKNIVLYKKKVFKMKRILSFPFKIKYAINGNINNIVKFRPVLFLNIG